MWGRIVDVVRLVLTVVILFAVVIFTLIGIMSVVYWNDVSAQTFPPDSAVVRSQDDTGIFVVYVNVNGKPVPCIVLPASPELGGAWGFQCNFPK